MFLYRKITFYRSELKHPCCVDANQNNGLMDITISNKTNKIYLFLSFLVNICALFVCFVHNWTNLKPGNIYKSYFPHIIFNSLKPSPTGYNYETYSQSLLPVFCLYNTLELLCQVMQSWWGQHEMYLFSRCPEVAQMTCLLAPEFKTKVAKVFTTSFEI